ncbi:type I polyketide synthase [Amycolatopsis sp. NPDC004368]
MRIGEWLILGSLFECAFSASIVFSAPLLSNLQVSVMLPRSDSSSDRGLIAVVGVSCRLPKADRPDAFWNLLSRGMSGVGLLPESRREMVGSFGDDLFASEPLHARWGGFVDDLEWFDAGFFGISPREAAEMDPQQRLVLELGWEALEDAGIIPANLRGERAGVFVGSMGNDYAALTFAQGGSSIGHHSAAGISRGMIANRLSYFLRATGPSLTIDTGQSSSLVAVHMAAESLRAGDCGLALVGGVNLNLIPQSTLALARMGGLSPDGQCYTFDARANGFVRGEGGAFVVLKPLIQAMADGNRVYCVIRGSAVNNDGGGDSLLTPSLDAQREVLREAYRRAGVDPCEVDYVELHGTGTGVGDPIEAGALGAVLGARRDPRRPLLVGSVKTNIGHLEGAAGVAGLVKTALALSHRTVPPSLNFRQPNPGIDFGGWHLRVADRLQAWPYRENGSTGELLAGVSSFGMGGTNCHVVVSSRPQAEVVEPGIAPTANLGRSVSGRVSAWVISARSKAGLRGQAASLAEHVTRHSAVDPVDVGLALVTRRSTLEHRAVVVGRDRADLLSGLSALAEGKADTRVASGVTYDAGAVAFVFAGQGSQRIGMGRQLHARFPVFAESFDSVCRLVDEALPRPLGELMFGDAAYAPTLGRTEFAQPALFAFEVAIFRLLQSWGVSPDFVAGHSIGEISAAYVAGVLSLPDACRLVVSRGRLMQKLPTGGVMLAVRADERAVADLVAERADQVSVAAVNAPSAVVLSGAQTAVDELEAHFTARGFETRRLRVSHAFHSPLMEPMLQEFGDVVSQLSFQTPALPIISTVTGRRADLSDPGYWVGQVRATVRFADSIRALAGEGVTRFVHLGPDATLSALTTETIEQSGIDGALVVPVARKDRDDAVTVLSALAELHVHGASVDWTAVLTAPEVSGREPWVDLPTYAFQRERYWSDKPLTNRDFSPTAVSVPDSRQSDSHDDPLPETDGLKARLTGMSRKAQEALLVDLLREEAAVILGFTSARLVEMKTAFKELGFDSVMTVELSGRINAATGLKLPATVVFENPTIASLAGRVLSELAGPNGGDEAPRAPGDALAVAEDDPLAIVGMACRLPGGVSSPEELWQLVAAGGEGIGEFPADRGWDLDSVYDLAGATAPARRGGFLYDATTFDAEFFNIAPREALAMDPQQRLLLEATWEALERAGVKPESLRGTSTGVYIGASPQEYGPRLETAGSSQGFVLTGISPSVLSGRVAYVFGFEGPAVTVDTACSSSLVALHQAGQALRSGDCDLAVVGGVAVMSTPGMFVEFDRQGGLSADGRCKSFAEEADGTAWSEGVEVLVVERLSDARRRGHRVRAVVRGSAVNQDGASNGLTAPNGLSQQRLIRTALSASGISAAEVDVVEAHGTGTRLGDPIEAQALLATYGQDRPADRPLLLGSVKSNIGHTQAAAGLAGVIKMVMAMEQGLVPRTLHVDTPTSQVDWTAGNVRLLTETVPWPSTDHPRRAGVSSFGISGTNAHVIIEQPPALAAVRPEGHSRTGQRFDADRSTDVAVPWVVSARSPAGLRAQAAHLVEHVVEHDSLGLADLGRALVTERSAFEHRAVVLAHDRDGLVEGMSALSEGVPDARVVSGIAREMSGVVFVFAGQGSQWAGMAEDLCESSSVFRMALEACERALSPWVSWSLREVLADPVALQQVDVVQPALWAMMVSLAELWQSAGLRPDAVMGHSQGEIAAACVAGVLSLEEAARIVALRSQALTVLSGRGAMASLRLSREETVELLAKWRGRVAVAALNGPDSTVVSGDAPSVEELVEYLNERGVEARKIAVDYASHGTEVDAIREELLVALGSVSLGSSRTALCSTVTGAPIEPAEMGAHYWYANLREPVLLHQAARTLLESGHQVFVEVSPHPVLTSALEETIEEAGAVASVVGTLRRGRGGLDRLLQSAAELHVLGTDIDWPALFGELDPVAGAEWVDLPTYPFQRERFWPETDRGAGDVTAAGQTAMDHPLLDAAVELPGRHEIVFTARLSLATHPWLADHVVAGVVVLPGAGVLELVTRAGDQLGCAGIEELTIQAPLIIPHQGGLSLRIVLESPDERGRQVMRLHSRPDTDGSTSEWIEHATGVLAQELPAVDATRFGPQEGPWPPVGAEAVPLDTCYQDLAAVGLTYGPVFQSLRRVWRADSDVFAEVRLPETEQDSASRYGLHPVLLDGAFQVHLLTGTADEARHLPFSFNGVRLYAQGATALRVHLSTDGTGSVAVRMTDADGRLVASIDSLVTREFEARRILAAAQYSQDQLFHLQWIRFRGDGASRSAWGANRRAPWVVVDARLPGRAVAVAGARTVASLSELEAVLGTDGEPPEVVLIPVEGGGDRGISEAVRNATTRVLAHLRTWLADERFSGSRLAFLTQGAIGGDEGCSSARIAARAVWGLVRAAQAEHPGRFTLIDTEPESAAQSLRRDVLAEAMASGEPQLTVRGGEVRVGRLARLPRPRPDSRSWNSAGTVLITGGTGGLGRVIARHLVDHHGSRHVVLASRRGDTAEGAADFVAELRGAGAEVSVIACDLAERREVERLLSTIAVEHPLTAVIHAAGVLDDGVVASMSDERLDTVLRPKVDAAWHLHELTADLDLAAFVMFSSVAGTLGTPGQTNYAAANAGLDAIAEYRRGLGLPSLAIAWGLWVQPTGMTASLNDRDVQRSVRSGMSPLDDERGLALFDSALQSETATVVAMELDSAVLRAGGEHAPLVLRGLLPSGSLRRPTATGTGGGVLMEKLTELSEPERRHALLELIADQTRVVLGHTGDSVIDHGRSFHDMGFDSLTSVELRNRLAAETGLKLPATLLFDEPNPAALARYLLIESTAGTGAVGPRQVTADVGLASVETAVTSGKLAPEERPAVIRRLTSLLAALEGDAAAPGPAVADRLAGASDDEMYDFLGKELGIS